MNIKERIFVTAPSLRMLESDYYTCKPENNLHDEEAFASLFRNETTSPDEPSKYRALVRVRPTAQEK